MFFITRLALLMTILWMVVDPAGARAASTLNDYELTTQTVLRYVQVIPHLDPDRVEIKLWFNTEPSPDTKIEVELAAQTAAFTPTQTISIPMPGAARWTPETPNLHTALIRVPNETVRVRFGLRRLEVRGTALFLNGEPFYLRSFGKCDSDNVIMPMSPLTEDGFRNYVQRAREFGYNALRSHAFEQDWPRGLVEQCDEQGMFMWPEFQYDSSTGNLAPLARFWNHASMMWWTWGNEMHGIGSTPWAQANYAFVKQIDPSRVIQDNSGWGEFDRETTDIFNHHLGYYFPYAGRSTFYASYAFLGIDGSVKGRQRAEVMEEMRQGTFKLDRPLIAHETANYQSFPDVTARAERMNFFKRPELVEKLKSDGRIKYLETWVLASAQFKSVADKLTVEQLRKSPILAGYESWMLSDFPEVFSGMVEDGEQAKVKRGFDPAFYRGFNAANVLLTEFEQNNTRRVFQPGEQTTVRVFASVYGPRALTAGPLRWSMQSGGKTLAEGKVAAAAAPRAELSAIADLKLTIPALPDAKAHTVEFKLSYGEGEDQLSNQWTIWIFPQEADAEAGDLRIVTALDPATLDALEQGARVWLTLPAQAEVRETTETIDVSRRKEAFASVLARYRPGIWEWGHNLGAALTDHPALREFPHEGFSDLQCFNLIDHGRKIILDGCPFAPDPIVHAIDIPLCVGPGAAVYARRGTYLFELAVGKGRLLVSGFNFSPEALQHIEVRALHNALIRYAAGPEFNPNTSVEPAAFREYVTAVKPEPRLAPEGHWDTVFYTDEDVAGRDMFMLQGEAQPFIPLPELSSK